MANKYVRDEDAERLDELAEEAGVTAATLFAVLIKNYGEQARDLAAAARANVELVTGRTA